MVPNFHGNKELVQKASFTRKLLLFSLCVSYIAYDKHMPSSVLNIRKNKEKRGHLLPMHHGADLGLCVSASVISLLVKCLLGVVNLAQSNWSSLL